MSGGYIRIGLFIYGLIAILTPLIFFAEKLSILGYVIVQLIFLYAIERGWRISFLFPQKGVFNRMRYQLGAVVMSLGFFISLLIFSLAIMSSTNENNEIGDSIVSQFAWIILVAPFALFMWLSFRSNEIKVSDHIEVTEGKRKNSEVMFGEVKQNVIKLQGKGKQSTDAIFLEKGHYKLAYYVYPPTEYSWQIKVNLLDVDDLEAEEIQILDEDRNKSGSETFTAKNDARYVFKVETFSWESVPYKWEFEITKL